MAVFSVLVSLDVMIDILIFFFRGTDTGTRMLLKNNF